MFKREMIDSDRQIHNDVNWRNVMLISTKLIILFEIEIERKHNYSSCRSSGKNCLNI